MNIKCWLVWSTHTYCIKLVRAFGKERYRSDELDLCTVGMMVNSCTAWATLPNKQKCDTYMVFYFQLRKQLNNLEFHKQTDKVTDRHLALYRLLHSCIGFKDFGIQEFKDLGIEGLRDLGIQGVRDLGIQGLRDLKIQRYRDIGIQGLRYLGN